MNIYFQEEPTFLSNLKLFYYLLCAGKVQKIAVLRILSQTNIMPEEKSGFYF